MSSVREELLRVVENLPDDDVAMLLDEANRRAERGGTQLKREWPPAWFGAVRSGRSDRSQCVDELLADGFGR